MPRTIVLKNTTDQTLLLDVRAVESITLKADASDNVRVKMRSGQAHLLPDVYGWELVKVWQPLLNSETTNN